MGPNDAVSAPLARIFKGGRSSGWSFHDPGGVGTSPLPCNGCTGVGSRMGKGFGAGRLELIHAARLKSRRDHDRHTLLTHRFTERRAPLSFLEGLSVPASCPPIPYALDSVLL